LLWKILGFDRYADFVGIHGRILLHPKVNCKLESRDGKPKNILK
jgi:hypothetical protein